MPTRAKHEPLIARKLMLPCAFYERVFLSFAVRPN